MRIVDVPQFGGPEVLTVAERPAPEPGQGEVLIKVAAAGINRADLLQRQGHYPPPPGASPVLGMEVSGHIAEIGPGADSRWKVGDAICALIPGGGYAEYCEASAGCCLPVPKNVSVTDAAALPEAVFTVWQISSRTRICMQAIASWYTAAPAALAQPRFRWQKHSARAS